MDTWLDVDQVFKIKERVKNKIFGTKDLYFFFGFTMGEKERNPSFLSVILRVPLVGIRRAKN